MTKNIDPKLKKIGAYLKLDDSAIFLIPKYQRAYSWEIKHCEMNQSMKHIKRN